MQKFTLLFFLLLANLSSAYEHNVAICAIFKDEACFLKEWIEFHRLIGVDHFYLYNNGSQDHYKQVLSPYIKKGVVELFDWNRNFSNITEWNSIQCSAYQDAIEKTRGKVKWLALIDLDEFIVPLQPPHLPQLLEKYENYSGLGINWQCYGTSHVQQIPPDKLMIEALQYKAATHHKRNLTAKSIIRPEFTSHCINPHWVFFKQGFQVNADAVRYELDSTPYVSVNTIRLNHYYTGDETHLRECKYPRIKRIYPQSTLEDFIRSCDELNAKFDPIMDRFIPKFKKKMTSKKG